MDPQVEAAFDAWLASIGLSRNSQIPWGQEQALLASWEAYLLNWGKSQGRTVVAAPVTSGGVYQGPQGGSFELPRASTTAPATSAYLRTSAPSAAQPPRNPGPVRVAPAVGGSNTGGIRTAPRY
ncbi:MAG: hypothetical protein U0745_12775 [Polyangia bacterium]